jgi:hypothetical protein
MASEDSDELNARSVPTIRRWRGRWPWWGTRCGNAQATTIQEDAAKLAK